MMGPERYEMDVQNQNMPNAWPRASSDAVSATAACRGGQNVARATPTAASADPTMAAARACARNTMHAAFAASPPSSVPRLPNHPTM